MLRRGSFTGTQRKTNQLKQVVGAPKPASSRLRILSQGTSRCARHFFPLPLLLASSARRLTRERSLEDPRNGGRREKRRSGDKRLRGTGSYSEMGSEKFSNTAKSGYNKGTIRSDIWYLVVSKDVRRHRLISIDYITALPCHGRGREFESRRPRHFFKHLQRTQKKIWVRLGPIRSRSTPPAAHSLEQILERALQHQLLNVS